MLSFAQLHAADTPTKIKPAVILSGKHSAITKPMLERCSSVKEFAKVWEKHQDGDDRESFPVVDFDSFMVIAVFEGTYSEEGASIYVEEVVEDAEVIHLRLRFLSKGYQTGVVGVVEDGANMPEKSEADRLKRITQSYVLIVLPTSKKAVVIEEGGNSGDRKWKETNRLAVVGKKQ
jgi:hypothetical protein